MKRAELAEAVFDKINYSIPNRSIEYKIGSDVIKFTTMDGKEFYIVVANVQ